MGIDPDNGWQARYEILPGKEKVVSELKKLAKDSDAIYLATDLDREGEAIAWHLQEAIGGDTSRYHRVVFNEITAKGHSGGLQAARGTRRRARARPAGTTIPRPGRWVRSQPPVVGQSRSRPVGWTGAICCRAIDC